MEPSPSRPSILVINKSQALKHEAAADEVCISIFNPRQNPNPLPGFCDIMRIGCHDADDCKPGVYLMRSSQATRLIRFIAKHRNKTITIQAEDDDKRALAIALFISKWLSRPLVYEASKPSAKNGWIARQLRCSATVMSLFLMDAKLGLAAVLG